MTARTLPRRLLAAAFAVVTLAAAPVTPPADTAPAWTRPIAETLGQGRYKDEVYSVSLPRRSFPVTRDGRPLAQAFDLDSGLSFHAQPGGVLMMGELTVPDDGVEPVLAAASAAGLQITALHKHLLRTSPGVVWIHLHGFGDPARLAAAAARVVAVTGAPIGAARIKLPDAEPGFDVARFQAAFGHGVGSIDNGVVQFNLPIAQAVSMHGQPLPGGMGRRAQLWVQAFGPGQVVAAGELPSTGDQVNGLLVALERQHIDVVEVHNHMLDEQPRMFYTHFWLTGAPEEVARRLHDAVAALPLAPPSS